MIEEGGGPVLLDDVVGPVAPTVASAVIVEPPSEPKWNWRRAVQVALALAVVASLGLAYMFAGDDDDTALSDASEAVALSGPETDLQGRLIDDGPAGPTSSTAGSGEPSADSPLAAVGIDESTSTTEAEATTTSSSTTRPTTSNTTSTSKATTSTTATTERPTSSSTTERPTTSTTERTTTTRRRTTTTRPTTTTTRRRTTTTRQTTTTRRTTTTRQTTTTRRTTTTRPTTTTRRTTTTRPTTTTTVQPLDPPDSCYIQTDGIEVFDSAFEFADSYAFFGANGGFILSTASLGPADDIEVAEGSIEWTEDTYNYGHTRVYSVAAENSGQVASAAVTCRRHALID